MFHIKNFNYFLESSKYKLFIQPNGWSCGPSCIKMVSDYINSENSNIDDIIKLGGVDSTFGATQKRMEKILKSKNIDYELFKSLDTSEVENGLINGYVYIMLVYLGDYPHWILIKDFIDNKFDINDPYTGKKLLTSSELTDYFSIKRNNIYSLGSKLLVPNRIIKIKE